MRFYIDSYRSWLSTLLVIFAAGPTLSYAKSETQEIIIKQADSALSREDAHEKHEQWEAKRALRQKMNRSEELNFDKVNRRYSKEFDKLDKALDEKDACLKSANINAYWEPSTLRCLNRHNGLPISP